MDWGSIIGPIIYGILEALREYFKYRAADSAAEASKHNARCLVFVVLIIVLAVKVKGF